MESIIKDHMLSFLNAYNLISANQHGFTPNKSTFTLLVECVHDWTSAVESRSPVHVIYIDFKKASDFVSHKKLLYKLDRLGFSKKLIPGYFLFYPLDIKELNVVALFLSSNL